MDDDGQTTWRWVDTGSNWGAMVKTHVAQVDQRVQTAYRNWLAHAVSCDGCQAGHGRECETARPLWTTYREARTDRP